jgi:hypothetical protein
MTKQNKNRFERSIKMKTKSLFLIVLILALTALLGTARANLAVNESFELDNNSNDYPDNWDEWSANYSYGGDGYTAYHANDGTARTGLDCMEAYGTDYSFSYQDIEDFTIGEDFTLAAYFKDNDPTGSQAFAELTIEYRDGPRNSGTRFHMETYQATIPYDPNYPGSAGYHLVRLTHTVPEDTELITICIGKSAGAGGYLYDDIWYDSYFSSVLNPTPADGETVSPPAPGAFILSWENTETETSNIYWNAGAADVDKDNFDISHPSVVQIGTADQSENYVDGLTIELEKNYYWRVDAGGEVGPVWHFTTVNAAPETDAGLKQAKWLPEGGGSVDFQLTGTATDDILPPGEDLTYLWETVSGPGTVNFDDDSILTPVATISTAGDYELSLTVDDSQLQTIDTVKIRVYENDFTGLEARYDMDESVQNDTADDDHSGNSRDADRMADGVIETKNFAGSTFLTDGGHCDDGDGPAVGAIEFHEDAVGYLQCPDSSNDPNHESPGWADFRDEVTLAAWIIVGADGGFDDYDENIIAKGNDYRLTRSGSSDTIMMSVEGVTPGVAVAASKVNDGQWHHVAGTYDGAHICVYVDGVQEGCVETDGAQIAWDIGEVYDLTLGHNLEVPGPTFSGTMDEVRIHSIGLPYKSDSPEAEPVTPDNVRSILGIYQIHCGHQNCGNKMPGDVNQDCYVNIVDLATIAENWTHCSNIADEMCDDYYL